MTSTFLSYRLYSANLTQSLQRIAAEPANANDQKYFEANIGKVKNVDDFLNNYRLFTYAMKAYGLSDLGNAKALMKQVVESDLSDTNSVANRLNDSRYKDFAKAFNFSTSGAVGSSGQLQTSGQNQDLMSRLNLSASAAATTQTSLSLVTSVKSFESNRGLYAQVLTAYGLDTNAVSQAQVTAALESNLSDPLSFANRPDVGNDTSYAKLRAIAADFNFTSTGSIGDQKLLQSAQNTAATQTAYLSTLPATADAATQAAAQDEGAYYAKKMPMLTSVDQLVADPRLVAYVKTAFGISADVTTQQLKSVLTSNLTDSKSAANTFGVDPTKPSTTPTKYQLLASAFSIGTDGTAWDHGSAISSVNLKATTAAYTTAALPQSGRPTPPRSRPPPRPPRPKRIISRRRCRRSSPSPGFWPTAASSTISGPPTIFRHRWSRRTARPPRQAPRWPISPTS